MGYLKAAFFCAAILIAFVALFPFAEARSCSTFGDCTYCENGKVREAFCTNGQCGGYSSGITCQGGCDAAGKWCKIDATPTPSGDCVTDADCGDPVCSNGETHHIYCRSGGVCSPQSALSWVACPSGECADAHRCATGTSTVTPTPTPTSTPTGAAGGCATPCVKQFCRGSTRFYDGFCDDAAGECKYFSTDCPLGCNSATGFCTQPEKVELTGVVMAPSKSGLLLNGRDSLEIKGAAYGKDSSGNAVPYKGELRFDLSGSASKYRIFGPSAVKLQYDSVLDVKDGTFTMRVWSEYKIGPKVDLTDAKMTIRAQGTQGTATISLLSPAPVIKNAGLKSKPAVWQDSYGVFSVDAVDPDANIKSYSIKAEYGTIRANEADWEGQQEVAIDSKDPHFEFAWKAPKLTEDVKLEYMKKIKERVVEAAKQLAKDAVDEVIGKYADKKFATDEDKKKLFKDWAPSGDEIGGLYSAATNGTKVDVGYEGLGYVLRRSSKTYERYETYCEVYKTATETFDSVGEQARELGEASFEGGYFFEYAARAGIIAIDGYELYDGVYSAGEKLLGKEEDKSFKEKLKDNAKAFTIGVAKDSLQWVADNYKLARAKKLGLPFILKITVTDADGYSATKGILVTVEGYERVLA